MGVMRSALRVGLIAVLAIVIVVIGGGAAALFTAPFADWRRSVAAGYLSDLMGEEAVVTGAVDVDLGAQMSVTISGVETVHPLGYADETQGIAFVRIAFPLRSVLSGSPDLTEFVLEGARVDILAEESENPTGGDPMSAFGSLLSGFLTHTISGHFVLRDVALSLRDDAAGWNEKIAISRLTFLAGEAAGDIAIDGEGNVNTVPLKMSGTIGAAPGNPRKVDIGFSFPGSSNHFSGTVDTSSKVAVVDLQVRSQSDSLGDLLDAFTLTRVLEGTGTLSARLHGPMNRLRAEALKAGATGAHGTKLDLVGSIGDLNNGAGIDLTFSGALPPEAAEPGPRQAIIDITFSGFTGELSGGLGALVLDNLVLNTNIASAELRDIGPISVERIAKDDQGRLGILGIRVLNGPPEARTLDLSGDMVDALQFAGVTLDGTLDIGTADLLELPAIEDSRRLGRVRGTISVNDRDGSLGIEALEAAVTDSDLIALRLTHSIDDLRDMDDIALSAELKIPKFADFAAAIGQTSILKGPLEFNGRVGLSEDTPTIAGSARIDRTQLTGDIAGVVRDDRPFVVGAIRSDRLRLRDLRAFVDVLGIETSTAVGNVEVSDDFLQDIGVDLDINVKRIAEADKSVGSIAGKLVYDKEIVTLDPLRVSFMGGTITAKTTVDIKPKAPRIRSTGKVIKIPVGRILKNLGAPPIVTGSLTTSFTIAGAGSSATSIARTLSGKMSASIRGGSVGTNLIDLSGLNLVTWLTTKTDKNTVKLVCARMPFSFKNGRGTTGSLVFETDNVQIVGGGAVDFRKDTINLRFQPIPKRKQMVDIVTPFSVIGKVSKPAIKTEQSGAGRAVAEVITMPFNILGLIVTGGEKKQAKHKPCVVPKDAKAQAGQGGQKPGKKVPMGHPARR